MDNIQELLKNLQALENKPDYKAINNLLTDELLQQHNNGELYIFKATACNTNNQFDKALSYAERAVVLERGNKEAYYQRGFALCMLKQYQTAIADFDMVLKYVNNPYAFWCRATCWYKKGEFKKAIEDYSSAISTDNKNSVYYYERGLCKISLLEYEEAIKDFDKATEINEDYYQAYCDRGLALFSLQRYEEALKNYDMCLARCETYTVAQYNKGFLYHTLEDYEHAIKNYTNAIANYNDPALAYISANAYNNRGNVYMIKQSYDLALDDIKNALAIDPTQGVAYLNRGIILQQLLNYDDAKEEFATALGTLQRNEEANKPFLNFLEEQIKLCDEKVAEFKTLRSVEANKEDIKSFEDITKKLDELIDGISMAAKSDVTAVVHYTKLLVADIYVTEKDAKMNYSNAIYMNDPTEGTILLNYLKDADIKSAIESGEKLTEQSVYIGSFLPAENGVKEPGHNDELIMWRTYGRDGDGNEACGCSIIIDCKFFTPPVVGGKPVTGENADMLCKVIYIKDRANEQELLADKESRIEDAIADFKNQLLNLIKLKGAYEPQHAFCAFVDKIIFKKYSKIAYLFKSADYEYEHEVRVIKYVPRNSKTIKSYPIEKKGTPGKLYVESVNPILPYVQKIYLGPKVKDSPYWSLYLDYQVKQKQNEYKVNKKTQYALNAAGIRILKSKNKFV